MSHKVLCGSFLYWKQDWVLHNYCILHMSIYSRIYWFWW